MARGEGAEQCAATLLSVKAVSAESKSATVRFLMNEPRMPAGTHARLTRLMPGWVSKQLTLTGYSPLSSCSGLK